MANGINGTKVNKGNAKAIDDDEVEDDDEDDEDEDEADDQDFVLCTLDPNQVCFTLPTVKQNALCAAWKDNIDNIDSTISNPSI